MVTIECLDDISNCCISLINMQTYNNEYDGITCFSTPQSNSYYYRCYVVLNAFTEKSHTYLTRKYIIGNVTYIESDSIIFKSGKVQEEYEPIINNYDIFSLSTVLDTEEIIELYCSNKIMNHLKNNSINRMVLINSCIIMNWRDIV